MRASSSSRHSIFSTASKAFQVARIKAGCSDIAAALTGMSIVRHAACDQGAQQVRRATLS